MEKRMSLRSAERVLIVFTVLIFAALISSGLLSHQVLAEETILPIAEDNISNIQPIKTNYLISTEDGYSRIVKTSSGVFVEDYNDSFEIVARRSIKTELRGYAGFFNGEDNYFFVFYDYNEEENTDKEVIRVVKYSKNWKRLSAAKLKGDDYFGHEVRYPFDLGNCSMGEFDGKLYLATGHEGYVDDTVGQGHQGFLMYEIDESSMTGSIITADLWHSFSQHITVKDKDNIYILEESEGSESTVVSRINQSNKYRDPSLNVLKYGGKRTSAWAVATRATADGISYSDNNVIAVGSSIDQSKYDDYDYNYLYNIYLSVTPMNDFTEEATSIKWLGSFSASWGFKGIKLVKINNDRFLIMWEDYVSEGTPTVDNPMGGYILHYLFVDGNGDTITSEMTASVPLSDCEPVLKNGYVSWCASSNSILKFVSINAFDGSVDKKEYRKAGESATWSFRDGTMYINGSGRITDKLLNGFGDLSCIENLIISEGITEIGEYSFSGIQVETIVLPKSVTKICDGAFSYTKSLLHIYISDNVTDIGEDAFFTGWYWVGSGDKVYSVTIHCNKGSYASKYAENIGINCNTSDGGYDKPRLVWGKENGKWVYYNIYSEKVTGWQCINSHWYLFDKNGIMQTGWIQDGNNWYYFGNSGAMTTGWLQDGKHWYYFNSSGAMTTGWMKSDQTWYYLNSSGAMATGWKQIDKIWYYFRSSGAMATGWIQDGDKWYYFESSGAMATGWIESDGSWYYLGSSGVMVTGWLNVEDNWYYMNSSGSMTTGWLQLGKTWYYLNKSGHMVTGTQTINGKTYEFDSDGRWIE